MNTPGCRDFSENMYRPDRHRRRGPRPDVDLRIARFMSYSMVDQGPGDEWRRPRRVLSTSAREGAWPPVWPESDYNQTGSFAVDSLQMQQDVIICSL